MRCNSGWRGLWLWSLLAFIGPVVVDVFIGLAKYLVIWFKTFCGIQINGSFVPKAEVKVDINFGIS